MEVCFQAEGVDSFSCRVDGDVLGFAVCEEVVVDYLDSCDAGLGCGADFVVESVTWVLT